MEKKNYLRNIGLTGLGLAIMTKEEIDKFTDDVLKKSEMTKTEGKKMAKELLSKSEKHQKKLETRITKEVDATLKKMNLARQKDIDDLKKRIAKLEKKAK